MELLCVLFGKSEGLGCKFRNNCLRNGDDFDRAGCGRHRGEPCFGEDGKNFRSIVSDRVLIVCRNLVRELVGFRDFYKWEIDVSHSHVTTAASLALQRVW